MFDDILETPWDRPEPAQAYMTSLKSTLVTADPGETEGVGSLFRFPMRFGY
jgi:hypothetical protein